MSRGGVVRPCSRLYKSHNVLRKSKNTPAEGGSAPKLNTLADGEEPGLSIPVFGGTFEAYGGGKFTTLNFSDAFDHVRIRPLVRHGTNFNGVAVRSVFQGADGGWYVETHSYGNNVYGTAGINTSQGPSIFSGLDQQMFSFVMGAADPLVAH